MLVRPPRCCFRSYAGGRGVVFRAGRRRRVRYGTSAAVSRALPLPVIAQAWPLANLFAAGVCADSAKVRIKIENLGKYFDLSPK